MFLVILTAFTAVCGAAKLDKNYLPPITAKTAGGSAGALQAPFEGSNQDGLPTGSYTNDVQGVVVDAVNPGTRTSGLEPTGLGGPRTAYGSTDSKVGDAAFIGSGGPLTRIAPGFNSFVDSDESQDAKTRGSSVKFATDVGLENYSYEFETDNGISVGENGVATGGVQAEGGYSYKGDDGKTYSVTYTADENGYKPQGQHLPTPPPIPEEIVKSLEKNAKEEAAGLIDDGSYDAQKYNDDGDYSSNGAHNSNVKPTTGGGDATASGSYASHGNQAYRPSSGLLIGSYNPNSVVSQSSQITQEVGQVGPSGDSSLNRGKFGLTALSNQGGNNFGNHGQFGANFQSNQGTEIPAQGPLYSQSTENRFGFQATKSAGTDIGSQNVNTAYSSAFTTGSGSASAFASTGSDFGLKNEYQHSHGSDSLSGASFPSPSSAIASASVGPAFGTQYQQHSGSQHSSGNTPTATPQFSYTATPSFGSVNSNKASGSSNFGPPSYSQSGQSNVAGFGSEYLTSVNENHSTAGAQRPTVASISDNLSQSTNQPPGASASAFISENRPIFGQSNQQFNGFKAESNLNYPSRFGENQQSGNTVEYLPPVNIIESTGKPTFASKPQGSSSSSAASASGSQYSSFGVLPQVQTNNGAPSSSDHAQISGVQPTQPSPSFASFSSQGPTKVPDTDLSTPLESNAFSSGIPVPSPTSASSFSSFQEASQSGSTFQSHSKFPSQVASGQYKPQSVQSSLTHKESTDTSFASSTQQPALSQQQGSDNSYYYKQPSKPFNIPSASPNPQLNFPISSVSQQVSKFPNTPTTSLTGSRPNQGQSSSFYDGITQATVSSFPLDSSSSSQSSAQTSQFSTKPITSTQFGQSESSQQTSTQFEQKPIVHSQTQFSQSSISQTDSSQSPTQQYQGTVYQYTKPGETLPAPEHKDSSSNFGTVTSTQTDSIAKPSQILTDSRFGSDKKPSVTKQTSSSNQQVTYGTNSQFSSQNIGSSSQNTGSGLQYGNKPSSISGSSYHQSLATQETISQAQPVQQYQFGNRPFGSSQTSQETSFSQTQFGTSGYTFGQKPVTTQTSHTPSSTFGSYSQSSQLSSQSKKPYVSTQTPSKPQFGSATGQFGEASAFASSSGSNVAQYGSSQTVQGSKYQQPSQFGTHSLGATSIGSQSPKPFGNSPQQTNYQQSQYTQTSNKFGSQAQIGHTSQSNVGSGLAGQTSFGAQSQKPFGSHSTQSKYQQTQYNQDQKPFASKGSSFQIGQSVSDQKIQPPQSNIQSTNVASQSVQSSFSTAQSATNGYNYAKPQTVYSAASQFGQANGPHAQKEQQTQSNYHSSVTTAQAPIGQPIKSFGISSTQGSFQQTQSSVGLTEVGAQPTKATNYNFSQYQTSRPELGSQTFVSGQKPAVSSQSTASSIQTTQSGVSGSVFGQKPVASQIPSSSFGSFSQSSQLGTQAKQPYGNTLTPSKTQFGSTTGKFGQASAFASSTGSNVAQYGSSQTASQQASKYQQTSQFGTQSIGATSIGSTSIGSQTPKPLDNSPQQTNKPFGSSQTSQGISFSQTQLGISGSAFGEKPVTTQTSQTPSSTFGSYSQSSQLGTQVKQPYGSTQTPSKTQFGSTTGQFGQASAFASGTGSNVAQYGSSQTVQGSKYQQTSQFGTQNQGATSNSFQTPKPFSSLPSQTNYQQSQYTQTSNKFGSQPQSTQAPQSNVGSGQVAGQTSFGTQSQKPFGSHSIQSNYQQTQYNQGQKPFVSKGSSFQIGQSVGDQKTQSTQSQIQSTNVASQSAQSSFSTVQYTNGYNYAKPQSVYNPASQYGQANGPHDQKVQQTQTNYHSSVTTSQAPIGQPIKPFGVSSNQGSFQQTQSTIGLTQGGAQPTTATNYNFSKYQTSQSQLGSQTFGSSQKPAASSQSTVSSIQTTQSGVSGSVFGQKPVTSQIPSSSLGSYSQYTQFGTQAKQPYGSTQTPSKTQLGSTTGQFGQASAFASSTGSNVAQYGSSQTVQASKYQQTSQFGTQSLGATSIGSQTPKPLQQTNKPLGSSQTSQGTSFSQTQFGTSGSAFGEKPVTTQTSQTPSSTFGSYSQSTQFGTQAKQPYGSTQTPGKTQLGSTTGQFGQTSAFASGTGSNVAQYGSSQTVQASKYQQTSQFGTQSLGTTSIGSQTPKPLGTAPQETNKPFGSSQTSQGTSFSQTQFGTSGSAFEEKPVTTQTSQTPSSTFGSYSQSTQFGTQAKQPYGSTQTPSKTQFGSTTGQFGQASAFASSTGSNEAQYGSSQKVQGSKYQQTSQFGTQSLGTTSIGSQTPKPFDNSPQQTNYQQSQYTQTSNRFGSQPQIGQTSQSNVESGQVAGQTSFGTQSQKPLSSYLTQSNYQQTQYYQGQKPFASKGSSFQIGQSVSDQKTQSTQSNIQSAQSSFSSAQSATNGYNYAKPQTVYNSVLQFGQANGPQDQKVQQSQTNYQSSVTTSQAPIRQSIKPFDASSTQGTFQQTQSSIGLTEVAAQTTKETDYSFSQSQTSRPQIGSQPFKPATATSTQDSSLQTSSVSTSQSGLQPTINFSGHPFEAVSTQGSNIGTQSVVGSTSQFGVQPAYSFSSTTQKPSQIQYVSGEPFKNTVFSSTQAPGIPSRFGTDLSAKPEGPFVSTVQTPIVPVPGYEIATITSQGSFLGQGEEFGGPRDPPKFDDKTGYHY